MITPLTHTTPFGRVHTYEADEGKTLRVGIDISMREILRTYDPSALIHRTVQDLDQHLKTLVASEMLGIYATEIKKEVLDAIRLEVRRQVAAAVKERLEDFIDEVLS